MYNYVQLTLPHPFFIDSVPSQAIPAISETPLEADLPLVPNPDNQPFLTGFLELLQEAECEPEYGT